MWLLNSVVKDQSRVKSLESSVKEAASNRGLFVCAPQLPSRFAPWTRGAKLFLPCCERNPGHLIFLSFLHVVAGLPSMSAKGDLRRPVGNTLNLGAPVHFRNWTNR
jgi:hypothetical protein